MRVFPLHLRAHISDSSLGTAAGPFGINIKGIGCTSAACADTFWRVLGAVLSCSCPWAVAAEREAGYIMLGSMCAAAAPGLLAGRDKQQQVLELFGVALGPTAAEALTQATAGAGVGAADLSHAGGICVLGAVWHP